MSCKNSRNNFRLHEHDGRSRGQKATGNMTSLIEMVLSDDSAPRPLHLAAGVAAIPKIVGTKALLPALSSQKCTQISLHGEIPANVGALLACASSKKAAVVPMTSKKEAFANAQDQQEKAVQESISGSSVDTASSKEKGDAAVDEWLSSLSTSTGPTPWREEEVSVADSHNKPRRSRSSKFAGGGAASRRVVSGGGAATRGLDVPSSLSSSSSSSRAVTGRKLRVIPVVGSITKRSSASNAALRKTLEDLNRDVFGEEYFKLAPVSVPQLSSLMH